ncbi:HNH endonuclease (plasmid) [Deinococcus sp. D7000]|nr:HNH endonuclease [Deinococcus sp. D7000]QLG13518.1 HNH endonuclease [Deinococcus sp. D7000]
MDSVPLKVCTKCGESKSLDAFGAHKASKSGLRPYCKKCHAAQAAARYAANRERVTQINTRSYQKHRAARLKQKRAHQQELKSDPSWVEKRREHCRVAAAKARKANPIKSREAQKKYILSNPVKYRSLKSKRDKKYYLQNPDIYKANAARRRARLLAAPGKWTVQDIDDLFLEQDGKCFYCTIDIDRPQRSTWHIDHFIPLFKGGDNFPSNLVIACQPCNASKRALLPHEFMPDRFPQP